MTERREYWDDAAHDKTWFRTTPRVLRSDAVERAPASCIAAYVVDASPSAEALARLESARQLSLVDCVLSTAALEALAGLPKLSSLFLQCCRIERGAFVARVPPRLKDLITWDCGIMDEDVRAIARCDTLQRLVLGCLYKVTDAAIVELGALSRLRELYLDVIEEVTDRTLSALSRLRVEALMLLPEYARFSEAGLRGFLLSVLSSLRWLTVDHAAGTMNGVTDEVVSLLGTSALLEHLSLSGCEQLTDEGIRSLSDCGSLRELIAMDCPGVTRSGLSSLATALPSCTVRHNREMWTEHGWRPWRQSNRDVQAPS